jgi:hypothetical protein
LDNVTTLQNYEELSPISLTRPGVLLSSVISLVSPGGIWPSPASFSVGVSVVDVLSFFLRAKAHSLHEKGSALEV